jgi:hypothetical protein
VLRRDMPRSALVIAPTRWPACPARLGAVAGAVLDRLRELCALPRHCVARAGRVAVASGVRRGAGPRMISGGVAGSSRIRGELAFPAVPGASQCWTARLCPPPGARRRATHDRPAPVRVASDHGEASVLQNLPTSSIGVRASRVGLKTERKLSVSVRRKRKWEERKGIRRENASDPATDRSPAIGRRPSLRAALYGPGFRPKLECCFFLKKCTVLFSDL